MPKCKYCKNLCLLKDNNEAHIASWCSKKNNCVNQEEERECEHYSPPTQADLIRNMTDEELADLFTSKTNAPFGKYHNKHGTYYHVERKDALKEELEWLQSPLEVDIDEN